MEDNKKQLEIFKNFIRKEKRGTILLFIFVSAAAVSCSASAIIDFNRKNYLLSSIMVTLFILNAWNLYRIIDQFSSLIELKHSITELSQLIEKTEEKINKYNNLL